MTDPSTQATPAAKPKDPGAVTIPVSRSDLPLSCPQPGAELWNMHPRVYLPIEDAPDGEVVCPYCGARYRLSD